MRRVRDRATTRTNCSRSGGYHPFFTNSTEPAAAGRHHPPPHAIIETVFADLIDGPLAHLPSGQFAANGAWAICAAITHNLLRAAGTLAGNATPSPAAPPCAATSSPSPPAWPARTPRPSCTYPADWPWAPRWLRLWTGPPTPATSRRLTPPPRNTGPTETSVEELDRPAGSPRSTAEQSRQRDPQRAKIIDPGDRRIQVSAVRSVRHRRP